MLLKEDEKPKVILRKNPRASLTLEEEQKIIKAYETKSAIEVANEFNTVASTVYNVIKRAREKSGNPSIASKNPRKGMRSKEVKIKNKEKTIKYEKIHLPSEENPPKAVVKTKSKVAVLISDDTQSLIDILKGL